MYTTNALNAFEKQMALCQESSAFINQVKMDEMPFQPVHPDNFREPKTMHRIVMRSLLLRTIQHMSKLDEPDFRAGYLQLLLHIASNALKISDTAVNPYKHILIF